MASNMRLTPQNPFPVKLYDLLGTVNKLGFQGIISWLSHGRAFMVHDEDKFVTRVMPLLFKATQIRSFTRQLNIWGFKRIRSGRDMGAWFHTFFLRGRPQDLKLIIRIKVKGATLLQERRKAEDPNFYAMEPMVEKNAQATTISSSAEWNATHLGDISTTSLVAPEDVHERDHSQNAGYDSVVDRNMNATRRASLQHLCSGTNTNLNMNIESNRPAFFQPIVSASGSPVVHQINSGNNLYCFQPNLVRRVSCPPELLYQNEGSNHSNFAPPPPPVNEPWLCFPVGNMMPDYSRQSSSDLVNEVDENAASVMSERPPNQDVAEHDDFSMFIGQTIHEPK